MKKVLVSSLLVITVLLLFQTALSEKVIISGSTMEQAYQIDTDNFSTVITSRYGSDQSGCWFKFTAPSKGKMVIRIKAVMGPVWYEFKDYNGNNISDSILSSSNWTFIEHTVNQGECFYLWCYRNHMYNYDWECAFSICCTGYHTPGMLRKVIAEPSCTGSGIEAVLCDICGDVVEEHSISAFGHTPGERVVIEATCTEAGSDTLYCSVCSKIIEQSELPVKDHLTDNGKTVKESTCYINGSKEYHCSVCGELLSVSELPLSSHIPGVWNDMKPTTCTSDGIRMQYCSVCNQTMNKETVEAFGHSPMEWQVTREAVCLNSGIKEQKCSICACVIDSEEIPALGHSYSEWVVTIEATKDAEGERQRHCIHCGETIIESIPKVEKLWGIF